MNAQQLLTLYYNNAREMARHNNSAAAREYVLKILYMALDTYERAKNTDIHKAVQTGAFIEKWLNVARELRENGVTEFVRQCFELEEVQEPLLPVKSKRARKSTVPDEPVKDKSSSKEKDAEPDGKAVASGNIQDEDKDEAPPDFSQIVAEASGQGWCADIFDKNKNAVVEIIAAGADTTSCGTGFIISKNGYLITNDHVVYNRESNIYHRRLQIGFFGGKRRYTLKVLFSDKKRDIALCEFDPKKVGEFDVIKMTDNYSAVMPGADCLVIGNAFGMGLAPCVGIIRFTKNDFGDLVYTVPSNPGDSGAPVLNRSGVCIGVNKSKSVAINGESADGYSNATPMDDVKKLLDKWIKTNDISL